ncbi:MAG: type II toxin-antitoxin system VapC family toxin [Thermoproteota archaeon]|nr:type II toxin-antitoxin system VapC family toxin [Thermoproteota archaeon]
MTGKVIDSSVLTKYLLKEKDWEKIHEILLERPYTLDLAMKEVANAIWKRVFFLKDIDIKRAFIILNDLFDMKMKLLRVEPQDNYLKLAFEIAINTGTALYDSLFIAQAFSKNAILITADKKQYKTTSELGLASILI